ncbi:hydrogenase expression/formation protein HypE [Thiotrichales bacterium 19S11-10]|nr:hydrogenase expression/formation protein HypE [Thiotrichales bacterium 19S11-10]MCF6808008.1 hydrogenase expression/formation protein HypE [Thiotrichales bacterium 19S9-11]MCF6812023.1 hydrogenase expression/formation protein HypE [Thiotrichales bacterium 19S9-12]
MIKLNFKKDIVDLSMGSGGKSMNRLIDQLMLKAFDNPYLNKKEDQAVLPELRGKLAYTTDSYVVSPYFFPGGDIGSLAIHGTVNDLAVSGATPLYISVGFILEEGLPLKDLQKIVISMAKAAEEANVSIVTGDTKVVEKGKADGIFINTSGIGVIKSEHQLLNLPLEKGDKIIINGNIAEHGIAVMSERENLSFMTNVLSDSCALNDLTLDLLSHHTSIKAMRDPTRGGIAATLNEWANEHQVGIVIDEKNLPVTEEVSSACELLGLDPLFIANEGKVLIVCKGDDVDQVLDKLHQHQYGKNATIVAEIDSLKENEMPYVAMKTQFGGLRRVDWLSGEQLPRIC